MTELEAAAERLRQVAKGESYRVVYPERTAGEASLDQIEDEQEVIAAYLAEHDPTPLDEAWLRSVGGDMFNHPAGFWAWSFSTSAASGPTIVSLAKGVGGWHWGFGIDTIKFSMDGTRGGWRTVCRVLSIPRSKPNG